MGLKETNEKGFADDMGNRAEELDRVFERIPVEPIKKCRRKRCGCPLSSHSPAPPRKCMTYGCKCKEAIE